MNEFLLPRGGRGGGGGPEKQHTVAWAWRNERISRSSKVPLGLKETEENRENEDGGWEKTLS